MTTETGKPMSASEKLDALEEAQQQEFNQRFAKSMLYTLGEQRPQPPGSRPHAGRLQRSPRPRASR